MSAHDRVPKAAGTRGIAMVAAMQSSIFTSVEGASCSSVMTPGHFRQVIAAAFALVAGGQRRDTGPP